MISSMTFMRDDERGLAVRTSGLCPDDGTIWIRPGELICHPITAARLFRYFAWLNWGRRAFICCATGFERITRC